MEGHVKLHRKILSWEWYLDINTCRLFIHLLLRANWKSGRYMGTNVERGELVITYPILASETGLSIKEVRTALNHLLSTEEIEVKRQAKFSVITIKNYDTYQQWAEDEQSVGSQRADKGQAQNSQKARKNQQKIEHQAGDRQSKGSQEAGKGQAKGSQGAGSKEEEGKKEIKQEKNINTMCKIREARELFERLWKLYPNKRGKGQVSDVQKTRLLAVGESALVKAIERYSTEL